MMNDENPGSARGWDSLMTWVTVCSNDMGYTFAVGRAWRAPEQTSQIAGRRSRRLFRRAPPSRPLFSAPAEKLPIVSREARDTAGGGARAPRHSCFGILSRDSPLRLE